MKDGGGNSVEEINCNVNGDNNKNETDSSERTINERENEKTEIEQQNQETEEFINGEEEENEDEDERPKLEDGFYELEAIRQKRVRKGKPQYLIKWRDWPESANTWEPLKNLEACKDVIKAFEDSFRSGKSSKKHRRKSTPHSKKKPPLRSTVAPCYVTNVEIGVVEKNPSPERVTDNCEPSQPVSIRSEGENNVDVDNTNGSKQNDEREDKNECDPKLSEPREITSINEVGGPSNGIVSVGKCFVSAKRRKLGPAKSFVPNLPSHEQVKDDNLQPGFAAGPSDAVANNGAENPDLIRDNTSQDNNTEDRRNNTSQNNNAEDRRNNTSQNNNAEDRRNNTSQDNNIEDRRNNTSQDNNAEDPRNNTSLNNNAEDRRNNTSQNNNAEDPRNNTSQNNNAEDRRNNTSQNNNAEDSRNNTSLNNNTEDLRNASSLIRIIKPVSFSASILNDAQEVSVTFVALRTDGTEAIVSNEYLKTHNPLLLIDFYENHLKYKMLQ